MPMLPSQNDAEAGAAADGGRRPTVVAAPASASPELSNRPRRRAFTARDKLRILAETDRALEAGGVGAVLRREGVYSSTLCDWRRQRDAGAFDALTPVKRGPKTAEPNPLMAEVASLQKDNAHLTRCLARPEAIIAVQKNLRTCWGSRWSPAATGLDRRCRGSAAGQRHDRGGLRRGWGFARHRGTQASAAARPHGRAVCDHPPTTTAGAGADRAATAGGAGSAARAAFRRPGAGRDLRNPAR